MASELAITVQRGEWWEVGATVTDPTTKQPRDISGRAVTVVLRSGPKETDPAVTIEGMATAVLNGPAGQATAGGRQPTPGTHYGTVQIGSSSDGAGWPAKERFKLTVTDCP